MTSLGSIPPDPALPQLRSLLDPELMSPVLARSLPPDHEPPAVAVRYLRYRPGRTLLVGYEVDVGGTPHDVFALADTRADLAARAAAPESSTLVATVAGRTPAKLPLAHEGELDALVQWLPLDLDLPAMAESSERLRERLVAAGLELDADDVPLAVKHKPTTRGVLRLRDHFAKAYPARKQFRESVRALAASASLPFPSARCTAVLPELSIAVQSRLPGERPRDPTEVASEAGDLLAALHAQPSSGLPVELPRDQLKKAARQARLLATILPRLGSRVERLLIRFEELAPAAELVTSHGGFHISQILRSNGRLAVVDFDGMCSAPPALDLASYVASVIDGPDDVSGASELLDELTAAYGRRPAGLTWYLAAHVLGRARRPFARLEQGWPGKVEERVAAAEIALGA